DEARERGALVAARPRLQAGGPEQVGGELGGRGLAVRPGHADDGVRERAGGQLQLAPYGHARLPGRRDRRRAPGHAGALHDEVHLLARCLPRRPHRAPGRLEPGRVHRRPVHGHHLAPLLAEEERRSAPRAPEAHDQRAPRPGHPVMVRKYSVKPTAPKIAAMSQKRMMIFVSLQAAISKWWWMGVMRKTRRWYRLNTTTWMITGSAPMPNPPQNELRSIRVLVITAMAAMAPPSA